MYNRKMRIFPEENNKLLNFCQLLYYRYQNTIYQ